MDVLIVWLLFGLDMVLLANARTPGARWAWVTLNVIALILIGVEVDGETF